MKLYHGTKKEFLADILKEGLKRGKNNGDSFYIYTCKDPEDAKDWGDLVLEVDSQGLNLRCFEGEISVWQILINGDVDPGNIKIFK